MDALPPTSTGPAALAAWLLARLPLPAPGLHVLGLSGLQGSGKSTLAAALVAQARARGLRAATLSLDDVYLDAGQRAALAASVHPLLATRGPPGSHELALLQQVLDTLHAGRACALPRFDKLADRRLPPQRWPQAPAALQLLVLEGWMLGVPAQSQAQLLQPVNALEAGEDADGRWRRWCNARLASDYPPLWQRIDTLCLLQAPGWEVVQRWRMEQERGLLAAAGPGARGMDQARLARFIAHFERTGRHALATLPALADLRIELDGARRVLARHARAG